MKGMTLKTFLIKLYMDFVAWFKSTLTFDRAWREPFNRAFAASQRGDWHQAIAEYSEAIRINPHLTEAYFNRALCHSKKKDWENAVTDCTEVLRLKPNHVKAIHWRGVTYRCRGKYQEALADFDKVLELNPNDARAFYDRGVTHRLISELPKALEDFTNAIQLELNAFPERGFVHARLGNLDLAFSDLTEAIRRQPEKAEYYEYRSWVSYKQSDLEAAILDLGEVIRLEPSTASHYAKRAFHHHAKGNFTEAIADGRQAVALDEKCVNAHNGLAWILATCPEDDKRDGRKAVGHALQAVELAEGKNLAYIGTLAAAYAEAGNFEEAVKWAKKFLDSDPPNENIEPARLRLALYEQGKAYREEKGKLETVRPRIHDSTTSARA